MVTEVEGEPGAQLYAAPDPEDDDRAKDAMDDLAAAVLQLQVRRAAEAGCTVSARGLTPCSCCGNSVL